MKKSYDFRKISYRIASLLMAVAMTTLSFFATSITSYAEFETEELNNRASQDGTVVKQVASDSATTTLAVDIGTTKGITIRVYKIADVGYSNGAYTDPTWVSDITEWLKRQAAYSTDGQVKTAFANPKNLASASASTWNEFYNNLLYNTKEGAPKNIIEFGYESDGAGGYNGMLSPVATKEIDSSYAESQVVFPDLQIGMYAIMARATQGAAKFNPIVVSLVPELNGPEGNYYLKERVTAELKASEAAIDKKINTHDSDSVKIGEDVTFTIDVTLPTLYADRVTLSSKSGISDYSLYVEDIMTPCFDLIDLNSDGQVDENDFTISYVDSSSEVPFPADAMTYYALADDTYDLTGLTENVDYFPATDENLTEYMYDMKDHTALGAGTFYIVKQSAAPYIIHEPSTKKNEANVDSPYFKIDFNVGVLKAYQKQQEATLTGQIRITYKAKVNNTIEINSENNKNTAKVIYEGGDATDIVRAYTYGLQVIKIDGTTKTSTHTDYIAGAQFALFKESSTYIKSAGGAEYIWKADMKKSASDQSSKTFTQIEADINTNKNDSDYYLYKYTAEAGEELPSGYVCAEGDQVARLFERVKDGYIDSKTAYSGTITSVANADGITLKGLDDGYFVLVETHAPTGYNELAEDILFRIGQIDYDQAQLAYNGSLASCLDLDDEEVPTGIISLSVLNYKGLTLPSTGGKGILMFTVLGMCIMMATMVIIIARQRKQSTDYYM